MTCRTTTVTTCLAIAAFIVSVAASSPTANGQIEGFAEPFRSVELASDESGTIFSMFVTEGDRIAKGDPICALDNRAELLKVELAKHLAQSDSGFEAAKKTYEKRQIILERLQNMHERGHASDSELIRAELELAIAESKYFTAQEDVITREIELRRSELELAQRTIVAPFDGVVAKIYRRQGEFLSPVKPDIIQLVQIDTLLAVFPVPTSLAKNLQNGSEINVNFDDGSNMLGTIHSIAVATDAQSDTIQVKIRINNALGNFRSGQRCFLQF